MNESSLKAALVKELRRRRFTVFNHTDRIVTGIPDTSASRNHKTLWLESKIIKVSKWKEDLDWSRVIRADDMVQLANMVRLERDALALYVLFQVVGAEHRTHVVFPNQVLFSVKNKKSVPLGTGATLQQIGEWV